MSRASTLDPQLGEQLDLAFAEFRPLLTVDEARCLLADPCAQLVRDRLDDGTLRGVDISAEGEAAGRRELRIYRYSVLHLLVAALPGRSLAPLVRVPIESIFPHRGEVFRRGEVAQILNCHPRHVANLPLVGPKLSSAACTASASRTPRVLRVSLIEFLTVREIQT